MLELVHVLFSERGNLALQPPNLGISRSECGVHLVSDLFQSCLIRRGLFQPSLQLVLRLRRLLLLLHLFFLLLFEFFVGRLQLCALFLQRASTRSFLDSKVLVAVFQCREFIMQSLLFLLALFFPLHQVFLELLYFRLEFAELQQFIVTVRDLLGHRGDFLLIGFRLRGELVDFFVGILNFLLKKLASRSGASGGDSEIGEGLVQLGVVPVQQLIPFLQFSIDSLGFLEPCPHFRASLGQLLAHDVRLFLVVHFSRPPRVSRLSLRLSISISHILAFVVRFRHLIVL
mmetsp:Transcript_15501/g.37018  ORF Transcript_15501/g.37018 Transcript_15501/m.37018 type:complete len:287 (-) Transcript_15501:22-882(-)